MNESRLQWPDVFLVMEWNGRTYEDSETRVSGCHFLLLSAEIDIRSRERINYDGTEKTVPLGEQFHISQWRDNKELHIYQFVNGKLKCTV